MSENSSFSGALEKLLSTYSKEPDTPSAGVLDCLDFSSIETFQKIAIELLLPARLGQAIDKTLLREKLGELSKALVAALSSCESVMCREPACPERAKKISDEFVLEFTELRKAVIEDIAAAYRGDPAAKSFTEVSITYPGLLAIAVHRVSHSLYLKGVPLLPRILSEGVHSRTAIDIHPGAKIGPGFFVDHGSGLVIGETATIGSNVKIYQGVTLGAKSFPLDKQGNPVKGVKRHPDVDDDVVIYANTTILGGDTRIGKGSVIGGNLFLTQSVEPGAVITSSKRSQL